MSVHEHTGDHQWVQAFQLIASSTSPRFEPCSNTTGSLDCWLHGCRFGCCDLLIVFFWACLIQR
jgi:hypothetical protein